MQEPDFRTPLAIHRAAFARVASGFIMPADGLEDLRRRFQAADRSGDSRGPRAAILEVLSSVVWDWPWLHSAARDMVEDGLWPFEWRELGLLPCQDWDTEKAAAQRDGRSPAASNWAEIPLGPKVDLVLATLYSALSTEKALAGWRNLSREDLAMKMYVLELKIGDERCGAAAAMIRRYEAAIRGGDLSRLPPFFPADPTDLRLTIETRAERRRRSEKRVGATTTREDPRPTLAETSPPTSPPDYQAAVQVMREATIDRRIKSGLRRWVSRILMTAGALFLIFVALGLAGAWDPPGR